MDEKREGKGRERPLHGKVADEGASMVFLGITPDAPTPAKLKPKLDKSFVPPARLAAHHCEHP